MNCNVDKMRMWKTKSEKKKKENPFCKAKTSSS